MLSRRSTQGLAVGAVSALAVTVLPLSATATVTSERSAPARLVATSADGPAFDVTEYSSGDVRIGARDRAGERVDLALRRVDYYWVVRAFDRSRGTVRLPGTGYSTTYGGSDGTAALAFPTDRAPGVYELYARLLPAPFGAGGGVETAHVLTLRAGRAGVDWVGGSPQQALAGGRARVAGTLELEDGTALPGRRLVLHWRAGTEAEPAGTGDAALVQTDGSLGEYVAVRTDTRGGFTATVGDVAEARQPVETGGLLDVALPDRSALDPGRVVALDFGVDFVRAVPVGAVRIAAERPLSSDGATPGRPVRSSVTVTDLAGRPVANQPVTLTTDRGFFTPYAASTGGLTPAATPAAGADAGEWRSLGRTLEVTTDGTGVARFTLAIERDRDFDEDGAARASVTAAVASPQGTAVLDTEAVDWSSADPLNGGALRVVPADGPQDSGVLPKAPLGDEVLLDVVAEDQFGNPAGGVAVRIDHEGAGHELSASTVTTDFDDDADLTATATQDGAQAVTASWSAASLTYTGTGTGTRRGTEQLEGGYEVEWYAVQPAASTFDLTAGPEATRVGEPVLVTYTANDQHGEPISDLFVELFRRGPGEEGDRETPAVSELTGQDGRAVLVLDGTTRGRIVLTAVGRERQFGPVVPGSRRRVVLDYGTRGGPSAAVLKGRSNGARADRLTVTYRSGARVTVYAVRRGERVRVRAGTMDRTGTLTVQVRDRNRRRRTTYLARVIPADGGPRLWTDQRRIR